MQEPSLRTSRLALARGIATALLLGGGGFLLGRATTERTEIVTAPAPVVAPTPAPKPSPATRTVLGRADLIALASKAADAVAAGTDPASALTDAVGQRFEVKLPFGCEGPADEESKTPMRWRYDAKDRALRVHAAPVQWTAADWWRQNAPAGLETVEGFWIARPWTTSEACPRGAGRPAATGPDAVTLPGQTLALGQIFMEDSPRRARRDGKPYQSVLRVSEDELDTSQGFVLRMTGRIAAMPGTAGAVRCEQPAGAEQRPICLIGVTFDRVAIERAADDRLIATWDNAISDVAAGLDTGAAR